MIPIVSFGAGRSPFFRRTSARRTVAGTRRRTLTPTTVSAPPGLTTEYIYKFTTPAFRYSCVNMSFISDPPGAAGSDPKWKSRLPFWWSRVIGPGAGGTVEDTGVVARKIDSALTFLRRPARSRADTGHPLAFFS